MASLLRVLKRELDSLTITQLSSSLIFFSLFLIAPIISILGSAFIRYSEFSLYWFTELLSDPEYFSLSPRGGYFFELHGDVMYVWGYDYGIILNSLIVAIVVALSCSIIGVIAALIMTRYTFPLKNFFKVAILVPMLATPFVNAYVLGRLFSPRAGVINFLLHDVLRILPWRIDINGLVGIAFAQILSYYPIVYLNVMASMTNIDPSMEEQAENLGAKGFRLFRTITFPLSLPGLAAGATVVFIFSMEDLGAPIGFIGYSANPLAKKVISYQIFSSFMEAVAGGISSETTALAVILLIISLTGFMLVKRYVSLKFYAMLSRGGRWKPRVRELGVKGLVVVYLFLILLITLASMPQLGVIVLAFSDWAKENYPTSFTLEYASRLVTDPNVVRAISNSVIYSVAAVIIAILVGSGAAYVVARSKIPGVEVLDLLATMPIAVPGIVIAVGYFLFFSYNFKNTLLDPLVEPMILLILAYSVRRMPFLARSVFAGLQQIHVALEEASLNLGAGKGYTFFRIVVPLLASNLLGGSLLTFVYSMSEVSTSVTLGALREDRGPITFYISQVIYGTAAVGTVSVAAGLCVLLMTIQIVSMALSNYILRQRVAFLGV